MALISCPECSKQVSSAAPQCPQCGYPLAKSAETTSTNPASPARATTQPKRSASPTPFPQQATHIVIHQPAKDHKGLARAAWILIFLVCGVALLPFLGFASWLVAGPVFFVTFILSIMVLSRGGTLPGILLLFTSIIGGPVFVTFAPFVSSFLGLGAAAKASIQNSERSATPQGNNYVNRTPSPPVVTPEEAARQKLLAAKRQVEEDLARAAERERVARMQEQRDAEEQAKRLQEEKIAKAKQELAEKNRAEEQRRLAVLSKLLLEGTTLRGTVVNMDTQLHTKFTLRITSRSERIVSVVVENPNSNKETRFLKGQIEIAKDPDSNPEEPGYAVATLRTTDQKQIIHYSDGRQNTFMLYFVPGSIRLRTLNEHAIEATGRFTAPDGIKNYKFDIESNTTANSQATRKR